MPAIRNFGYLWDRDRVFWGWQKVNGTLLGYHKKYGLIDFAEQKGIYLLHTQDLKIIYVGQVGSGDQNMLDRLRQHKNSDALWNRWRYSVGLVGEVSIRRPQTISITDSQITGEARLPSAEKVRSFSMKSRR
jgi:hypothetical protein